MLSRNRSVVYALILGFILSATGMTRAFAVAPPTINIRGQLFDSDGFALTGPREYTLRFFDAKTGGAQLGADLSGTVTLSSEGIFNISVTLPGEALSSLEAWYEIAVDTDLTPNGLEANELFPNRVKMESVPFALFAAQAGHVEVASVGSGIIDDAELDALDGVTSSIQSQLDSKPIAAKVYTKAEVDASQDALGVDIAANSVGVSTNAASIASNTTALSTNAADIAAADSLVSTNASGISTNASGISTNAVDIATKQTFAWELTSGTAVQAVPNRGYMANGASPVTITLPLSSELSVGETVRVSGLGAGGWKIAQNAGQQILLGPLEIPVLHTWTAQDSSRKWQNVASSADGTKLVAATDGGLIYTSADSGATWTGREDNRDWFGVASSADGTKLLASVNNGSLYTSTDSGLNWVPRDSPRSWRGVASSADGRKLLASEFDGQLYTSQDSGANWTARDSNRSWWAVASSADGTKLIASEFNGFLYTSINSGISWQARESDRLWFGVASSADGTRLAACAGGGRLYTSSDSGATWTARGSDRSWWDVASSADGTRLVAATNGGQLYISVDSGATWTPRDFDRDWWGVASSADGTKLVASAVGGNVYTHSDFSTETIAGTIGMVSGGADAALELQYIGNDTFRSLSHEGTLGAR